MREIYKNSTQNLVFVGRDLDGHGKVAIETLHRLRETLSERTQMPMKLFNKLNDFYDPQNPLARHIENFAKCDIDPDSWPSIVWFYSRPWFSRLWVIQEMNLNEEATTFCGSNRMDTHFISLFARWIRDHDFYGEKGFDRNGVKVDTAAFMSSPIFGKGIGILHALHCASHFEASDPRDRIYALLGMPHFESLAREVEVNYQLSTLRVYQNACQAIIKLSRNIEVLSYVSHIPGEDIPCPSWIPRWDLIGYWGVIGSDRYGNACIETDAAPVFDTDKFTITCCGKRLGIILDTAQHSLRELIPPSYEAQVPTNERHGDKWKQLLSLAGRYPEDEESIRACSAVLSCGKNEGGWKEDNDTLYNTFLGYISLLCATDSPLPSHLQEKSAELSLGRSLADYQYYTRALWKWSFRRRMFTTDNGYIGNGSQLAQKGDLVCILQGGRVPYILRPQDEHYLLISEAYVHDIMDGEAVSNGWEQLEMFVIH